MEEIYTVDREIMTTLWLERFISDSLIICFSFYFKNLVKMIITFQLTFN